MLAIPLRLVGRQEASVEGGVLLGFVDLFCFPSLFLLFAGLVSGRGVAGSSPI